ncbi:hypothetical protein K1X84_06525 [bacterium]|nr:hypothetical protein [bacterium]
MKLNFVFKTAIIVLISSTAKTGFAQVSFFNMPNPDMMPRVGYSYVEYDQYQTLKDNKAVNAYVPRISIQALPYLELGANFWFNKETTKSIDKVVLAHKWRIWLYQSEKYKISMSPGGWHSIYTDGDLSPKHLLYDFVGLTIQHSDVIYTRLMAGGYMKHWKNAPKIQDVKKTSFGALAGLEQRISKSLVFVTDYFQGSGEGYGLAPGFVYYATENGGNLPIYLAYQFDNDDRKNDLLLFEIGYMFQLFGEE